VYGLKALCGGPNQQSPNGFGAQMFCLKAQQSGPNLNCPGAQMSCPKTLRGGPNPTRPGAQVYCLKALRAIESGEGIDPRYNTYQPRDREVIAMLTRDVTTDKEPYKAAVEDCLIICMKGVAAGMQNTG